MSLPKGSIALLKQDHAGHDLLVAVVYPADETHFPYGAGMWLWNAQTEEHAYCSLLQLVMDLGSPQMAQQYAKTCAQVTVPWVYS